MTNIVDEKLAELLIGEIFKSVEAGGLSCDGLLKEVAYVAGVGKVGAPVLIPPMIKTNGNLSLSQGGTSGPPFINGMR